MTTPTPQPAPPDNVQQSLWDHVIDIWTTQIFDVSAGQLLISALILSLGWGLRGLLARGLLHIAERWVKRTDSPLDDKFLFAMFGPVKLLPIIIAVFVATRILTLTDGALAISNRLLESLIAVMMFWALRNAVTPIAHLAVPLRRALSPEMLDWMFQGLRVIAILLGAAVVLQIWGIPVAPILAGFGIFGVAVALGAQDFFKNVIAGLSILLERRFNKGDWILVDGVVEGTVERIGFRSTHVRRFDKSPVYLPNSILSDNPVTNFSRMTHRRIRWVIGLEYRTTADQLKTIRQAIEDHLTDNSDFASPPEVTSFVRIDQFNASSIDILIYAFTKTTQWVEYMNIKQAFALEVKQIVEDAGSAFAFPSTTLYLERGDDPPQFYPRQSTRKRPAKPKSTQAAS